MPVTFPSVPTAVAASQADEEIEEDSSGNSSSSYNFKLQNNADQDDQEQIF
jgi:hypothetical protein